MSAEYLNIPEIVPVFPLPEVVLFPRTILPLHIFEPRYRQMMADVLLSDRVIAVALLRPGYEPHYYTRRAPIHATIGVGQVVESEKVPDGNYNLLLRGAARAIIVEEIEERPYRLAQIEPVYTFCSGSAEQAERLCRDLFAAVRDNPGIDTSLREHWLKLADVELDLDELTDLLAAGMPVESELRQLLLEEPDAVERARMLLDQVRTVAAIAQAQRRAADREHMNFN